LDPTGLRLAVAPDVSIGIKRLLLQPAVCQNARMRRMDRYDIIGVAVVALLIALWVLHFVLPAPPPLPVL
jgi:hypothetical protein